MAINPYELQVHGPKGEFVPQKIMKIIEILGPRMEVTRNYKKRHENTNDKRSKKLYKPMNLN